MRISLRRSKKEEQEPSLAILERDSDLRALENKKDVQDFVRDTMLANIQRGNEKASTVSFALKTARAVGIGVAAVHVVLPYFAGILQGPAFATLSDIFDTTNTAVAIGVTAIAFAINFRRNIKKTEEMLRRDEEIAKALFIKEEKKVKTVYEKVSQWVHMAVHVAP